MAWSDSQLDRMVRSTFDNFGKYVIDFFQLGKLSARELDRLISVEHIDHLEQCRGMQKGIIGLSAHIGNWELGANVLELNGCKVNAVVRRQTSPRLDDLFLSRRIQRGMRVLPTSGAAGSALACLKRNEFVALLADLDFSDQERRVPFFGRPAGLPRGPAVLAVRSGAPILPGFVLRGPDDSLQFRLYPPIVPGGSRSVEEIQKEICAVLEDVIGNHPEQWFAFQPVW